MPPVISSLSTPTHCTRLLAGVTGSGAADCLSLRTLPSLQSAIWSLNTDLAAPLFDETLRRAPFARLRAPVRTERVISQFLLTCIRLEGFIHVTRRPFSRRRSYSSSRSACLNRIPSSNGPIVLISTYARGVIASQCHRKPWSIAAANCRSTRFCNLRFVSFRRDLLCTPNLRFSPVAQKRCIRRPSPTLTRTLAAACGAIAQ